MLPFFGGLFVPPAEAIVDNLLMCAAVHESVLIAVGTPITGRPPHNAVRATFPHTAPTLGA